jgi:prevent-host-death family protein
MAKVTLVEFRRDAEKVIRRVQRGERLVLTRRGRPVLRLEPIQEAPPDRDDPIYRLAEHAAPGGKSMTNRQIDRIVYGI